MPLYDLYCTCCDARQIDIFLKVNENLPECSKCGGKMARICGCKSFKLIYDNKKDSCAWGNEGYASSQYYREFNKQKAEGKNVRIPALDGDG